MARSLIVSRRILRREATDSITATKYSWPERVSCTWSSAWLPTGRTSFGESLVSKNFLTEACARRVIDELVRNVKRCFNSVLVIARCLGDFASSVLHAEHRGKTVSSARSSETSSRRRSRRMNTGISSAMLNTHPRQGRSAINSNTWPLLHRPTRHHIPVTPNTRGKDCQAMFFMTAVIHS
jgi:hypothetical protein